MGMLRALGTPSTHSLARFLRITYNHQENKATLGGSRDIFSLEGKEGVSPWDKVVLSEGPNTVICP